MRDDLAVMIQSAAQAAMNAGALPRVVLPEIVIERPARPEHGDYATSLPLRLARAARANPIEIAKTIAAASAAKRCHRRRRSRRLPASSTSACLIAGWRRRSTRSSPPAVHSATSALGDGARVQVEFVSANPTGPLTAGNGRGAAIGDVLASVLQAAGYEVEHEYLVNDAGTQTEVFGRTLLARYQQLFGRDVEIPEDGYPGDYMIDLAQRLKDEFGDRSRAQRRRAAARARASAASTLMVEAIQRRPARGWACATTTGSASARCTTRAEQTSTDGR